MPLTQDNESKGKAGFKLFQYMGLWIVSIASAITINNEIIKDKENSFLAENNNDWFNILKNILDNEIDLTHIGTNARKTILNNFTFNANLNKYLSFIKISINN
jgi:glycosyltransferase involved in cell wall biosynthesis